MTARVVELSTGKKYRPKKKAARPPSVPADQEELAFERRLVERKLERAIEDFRAAAEYLSDPSVRAQISYDKASFIEGCARSERSYLESGAALRR